MQEVMKKAAAAPLAPLPAWGHGRPKHQGKAQSKGKGKAPAECNGWEDEEDVTKSFNLDYPKYHAVPYYKYNLTCFVGLHAISTTLVHTMPIPPLRLQC
jgi:hypothetical protein